MTDIEDSDRVESSDRTQRHRDTHKQRLEQAGMKLEAIKNKNKID